MSTIEVLALNLAVAWLAGFLLWLVSLRIRDVSIVDIFWGPAFVLIAWCTYIAGTSAWAHQQLIVGLTSVWGLRLAAYLAWRNLGHGEDYRYRAMRKRMGPRFAWVSLFTVFTLQVVLAWIVSLPVQMGQLWAVQRDVSPGFTPFVAFGCAVFAIGLVFETVGDIQLARFKARPENQGKVMDRGLWRYTRHPNYFGDFMVWWGLYAVSIASWDRFLEIGWTAIGPALMSFLLLRVSGVALLERSLKKRRPGYEAYIRRTSAFFPWPPKRDE